MPQNLESPAGDGGAFDCLAGWRDTSKDIQFRRTPQDRSWIDGPRFERMVEIAEGRCDG